MMKRLARARFISFSGRKESAEAMGSGRDAQRGNDEQRKACSDVRGRQK